MDWIRAYRVVQVVVASTMFVCIVIASCFAAWLSFDCLAVFVIQLIPLVILAFFERQIRLEKTNRN